MENVNVAKPVAIKMYSSDEIYVVVNIETTSSNNHPILIKLNLVAKTVLIMYVE